MEHKYKIVILGNAGVGKSALTLQFVNNIFSSIYEPTIEDSYQKKITIEGITNTLELLDTSGDEEYSGMQKHYMQSGEGFICVYSVDSKASMNAIADIHRKLSNARDSACFPCVLVANKCDLENQEVSTRQGIALANELNCSFVECSAKFNVNVAGVFLSALKQIKRQERENIKKTKCILL